MFQMRMIPIVPHSLLPRNKAAAVKDSVLSIQGTSSEKKTIIVLEKNRWLGCDVDSVLISEKRILSSLISGRKYVLSSIL